MRAKKLFALLLAGSMMASVLTGCWGGKKDDSSSGTDGDSDITWTDPDYDEDEDAPVAEYTIAVDVGDYGTVKPASPIKVKAGDTATFTVTANEGWLISGIQIDNKDQPSSGPAETLKVSLDKVSANHTVTVKYEAKTFTVSATVSGGNGTVSPATQTVTYGGSASITVDPANTYEVDKVTATVGEVTNEVTSGSDTYTINNVTADVAFTVTFKESKIESISISGTNNQTEYAIGDTFSLTGASATITYENGDTESMKDFDESKLSYTCQNNNAESVEGGIKFTEAGTYTVQVGYENMPGQTSFTVKVNTLNSTNVNNIKNNFGTSATTGVWKNTLTVDNNLVETMKDATGSTVSINGKLYQYAKKGPVSADEINSAMTEFYKPAGSYGLRGGTAAKLLWKLEDDWTAAVGNGYYEKGTVCIDIDPATGACTMWVIEGYPAD